MDFSVATVKKNIGITFKRLSQLFIVVAVFFSMMNLYFYFSIPKEKQLSFEKALVIAQKRNSDTLTSALKLKGNEDITLSARIYSSVLCETIGDACGPNLVNSKENFEKSLAGGATKLFLFPLSNPPSSSVYVASKIIEKAGFIPPSYAAESITNTRGLGFASIEYISTIWLGLRNLAYIVIALIMISIGFMIMFRMKLGSQTVIAIENSIPRIIMALIAITFSFAIAGFLIDLMYVSIIIIAGVFGAMNIDGFTAKNIIDKYMFAGPDDVTGFIFDYGVWKVIWSLPGAIIGAFGTGVSVIIHLLGAILGWYFVISRLATFIGSFASMDIKAETGVSAVVANLSGAISFPELIKKLITGNVNVILSTALGLVLGLFIARFIVGFIILFTGIQLGIKIFVMLMSSYIQILLLIIFSPLILLAEAIPGKSTFTNWLQNLFAEIATFPITIVLFLVGALLIKSAFSVESCKLLAVSDPSCAIGVFPFLWEFDASSFSIIIAFGFLFVIPQYVQSFKKTLNPHGLVLAQDAGISMFFGSVSGIGKAGFSGLSKTIGRGINDKLTEKAISKLPPAMQEPAKQSFLYTGRNPKPRS